MFDWNLLIIVTAVLLPSSVPVFFFIRNRLRAQYARKREIEIARLEFRDEGITCKQWREQLAWLDSLTNPTDVQEGHAVSLRHKIHLFEKHGTLNPTKGD